MAAPLIVRLVMDAAGYLKTVDTAVGANTKLEQSSLGVGEAMQVSATKSVQASLRATEALQAQVVGYRELAASAQESAAVRERAALLANRAEGRLNSQLGLTSVGLAGTSRAAQTAERDLGKTTRGLLAGSGAAAGLGRSLAFASTGFIAIASAATIIKSSIAAAISLAATQRQVDAQLRTTGKTWDQYGGHIDAVDLRLSHVSGFTNQELLQSFGYLVRVTGNVSEALRLNAVAADVARGRNISLSSASIALGKALGGSETALKRLGITIPKNLTTMQALTYVQEKFAGQAQAGATVGERFHASLVDTEEIIGNALLPTFTRLTTEIGDWLAKMNETGRLQRDVNDVVSIAGSVFHFLGAIIGGVDKATGSFGNTLKAVTAAFVVTKVFAFGTALEGLAAKWGLVGAAATEAGAAQTAAVGEGAAAGVAARGGAAGAGRAALLGGLSTANIAAIVAVAATVILNSDLYKRFQSQSEGVLGHFGFLTHNLLDDFRSGQKATQNVATLFGALIHGHLPRSPEVTLTNLPPGSPALLPQPGGSRFLTGPGGALAPAGPTIFKSFTDTITNQLAQARAALTKSTTDDVAAARAEIALIKRGIARGHYVGASLIQALQGEASAQGVLNNARQAAAAQAAKIAAAKKAAASSYSTPIDLQLAEARAQLTTSTADDLRAERRILAAAKAAVASGKKNKQGQLAALQIELQAQQAIQSLTSQNSSTFTQSLKLQLALAKTQALGGDQTPILLKMKAALERALKNAKGNIQKQIDIWNQIAAINQQLGSSASGLLGGFKQASTKALTAGLGLSPAERKKLRERLSQLGPGGTVPGDGVGAGGFIIGPDGRPLQAHHHRRPHHGRTSQDGGQTVNPARLDHLIRVLEKTADRPIRVVVDLDGKVIATNTTRHQQRHRKRNPGQRRGPNAGN